MALFSASTSSSEVRRRWASDVAVVVGDVHLRPFLLGLEHDGGFDHVHRRGIGGGFGATDLAEDVVHLGKGLDDLVGLLEQLARFGRGDAREGGRHVEQVAFVERRHEFGADVLVGEQILPDALCAATDSPSGECTVAVRAAADCHRPGSFQGKNTQTTIGPTAPRS